MNKLADRLRRVASKIEAAKKSKMKEDAAVILKAVKRNMKLRQRFLDKLSIYDFRDQDIWDQIGKAHNTRIKDADRWGFRSLKDKQQMDIAKKWIAAPKNKKAVLAFLVTFISSMPDEYEASYIAELRRALRV